MLGTMIICLPAKHKGGDLVLSHNGVRKRFTTSTQQPTCACWYSDVVHEVTKVTAGYRLVLTFNLVMLEPERTALPAAELMLQQPLLQRALKAWTYHGDPEKDLLFALDHKYTEASLKASSLKTVDRARMTALQRYAEQFRYDIFLATMEHYRHGQAEDDSDPYERGTMYGCDWDEDEREYDDHGYGGYGDGPHGIDEVFESETKLKHVVDLKGFPLLKDVDVKEEQVINLDPYDEREPDRHEYEGFTGNAGAQSTHWYPDTVCLLQQLMYIGLTDQVVVLVPHARVADFLKAPFSSYGGTPFESMEAIVK